MTARDQVVVGRIATLAGDAGFRWVEAIAIADGRVLGAGAAHEVDRLAPVAMPRIRLAPDEVCVPAFTDAHLHLGEAALAAEQLDLRGIATLPAALAAIAERHAALRDPGEWLLGFGWHAASWGRSPTADDLESVAPGRPVFLWSHDHHSAWVSREAMRRAGLGPQEAVSGVFHEGEVARVAGALPPLTTERLAAAIERYAAGLLATGIVAVHDPGPLVPDPRLRLDVEACIALAAAGRLPVRAWVSVRADSLETGIARGFHSGESLLSQDAPPDVRDRCRGGWLKLFADGALGSRTAALLEPYEPEAHVELPAGERGFLADPDELAALVRRAAEAGIESEIHAIGDAAVRSALDAFAALPARLPGSEPGRGGPTMVAPARRVEHIQLVDPADLPRFASLGVVASVQPSHLATDAPGARAAWGARAEAGAYAYGSLERAGALLAFGSDAPVETVDPWLTLACAIHRSAGPGTPPLLGADQRLAAASAFRASSLGPALAAGDASGGRLTPGSRAEMLVIPSAALEDPLAARGSVRLLE